MMTAGRKTAAGVASIVAAVAVDVLGIWMASTGAAVPTTIPPAGRNDIVSAAAPADRAQITAPSQAGPINPLAGKRRKKPQ